MIRLMEWLWDPPLGPTLANVFMCFREGKYLSVLRNLNQRYIVVMLIMLSVF